MNKEVRNDINKMAMVFAVMHGFEVPDDYDFEESPHPDAMGLWNQAKASYEFWSTRFSKKKD